MKGELNELALFAGAGGGILGSLLLGWRTVCAVEKDTFCARRLMQRQNEGHIPPFPIWDDVYTFNGFVWEGVVDVVSAGFPCQAFSTAAHGVNTAKDLWPEVLRIVGEVSPRFVFCENVDEGAIINAQNDLALCGFKTIRGMVAAADMGADHPRERWWLVADSNNKGKLGREINAKMAIIAQGRKSIWEAKPENIRVFNGMAGRVDRYRAIGNGQVPIVAKAAWEILGPQ